MLNKKYTLIIISMLICTASVAASNSNDTYELAIKQFKAKKYIESESNFSQSIGYKARIGQAFSAFRLKNTGKSLSLFKQSILLSKNDNERFLALYNAATCSFLLNDYESASQLFNDANKYQLEDKETIKFIELSTYLAKLVRAQLARDKVPSNKKKSSEGKKTISSLDFVFDDDINLRLEDGDSSESMTINQQQLSTTDKELIKSLVAAGIKAVKIKDNGQHQSIPSIIDLDIIYEFSNLDSASYTPSTSISTLWKRMFEQDEGFPASLEEAEVIPGIRTW